MTYITARFGQIVAKPATLKTPGFFGLRKIGPRAEAKIGSLMAIAVAKEGHKAKLPPDVKPPFDAAACIPKALELFDRRGTVSNRDVRDAFSINQNTAIRVLDLMRGQGLIEYVTGNVKAWRRKA